MVVRRDEKLVTGRDPQRAQPVPQRMPAEREQADRRLAERERHRERPARVYQGWERRPDAEAGRRAAVHDHGAVTTGHRRSTGARAARNGVERPSDSLLTARRAAMSAATSALAGCVRLVSTIVVAARSSTSANRALYVSLPSSMS